MEMEKMSPPNYSPPGVAPPPGYGPPPGIAPPPVAVSQPYPSTSGTPVAIMTFGPNPLIIACPSCHQHVTTRVAIETSTKTHLMAALLCLISCCCIPYLIDSCKNKNHYCPSCGAYLGSYSG